MVLFRLRHGVVDEELDVGSPHELSVQERVGGFRAVDRPDCLRERDEVVVECLGGGGKRLRAGHVCVGRVHCEHCVLAEQVVERHTQVGSAERRFRVRGYGIRHCRRRRCRERTDHKQAGDGDFTKAAVIERVKIILCAPLFEVCRLMTTGRVDTPNALVRTGGGCAQRLGGRHAWVTAPAAANRMLLGDLIER